MVQPPGEHRRGIPVVFGRAQDHDRVGPVDLGRVVVVGGLPHDDRRTRPRTPPKGGRPSRGRSGKGADGGGSSAKASNASPLAQSVQTIVTSELNATFSPASTTRRSTSERIAHRADEISVARGIRQALEQSVGATIRAIPRGTSSRWVRASRSLGSGPRR